jgi:hypothetical protein
MQMSLSDWTAVICLMLEMTKHAACVAGELAKPTLFALVSHHASWLTNQLTSRV